jgi:hypothetical protein
MCSVLAADGHGSPGLVQEAVPGGAAMGKSGDDVSHFSHNMDWVGVPNFALVGC